MLCFVAVPSSRSFFLAAAVRCRCSPWQVGNELSASSDDQIRSVLRERGGTSTVLREIDASDLKPR